MKITIHYNEPEDAELHTSLKFSIPKKWLAQPTDKIRNFFVGEYNKKHPESALDKDQMHLVDENGRKLPCDQNSEEIIQDRSKLHLESGPPPSLADMQAAKDAEAAAAKKKAEDEKSLLVCKHFGCNARYRPEDNHDQACTYHDKAPIFHETAKWWSCCPQKKAYDWDTFQGIPGCQIGSHTDVDPKKKFLGGSDLREKQAATKLKSIDDFNSGKDDKTVRRQANMSVNERKLDDVKQTMKVMGVDEAKFQAAYDALCAKHNVKDMTKDLWKVSKELSDVLNDTFDKIAAEE